MSLLYRRRRHSQVRSDVNLTPLIDVMTSLLAIFMITAPLLMTGIPMDLPRGDGRALAGDEKTLDLSLNAKGDIFIGKNLVLLDEVLPKVRAILSENPSVQMVISADKRTNYGQVIELMALLRSAGYTQVGLRTDSETMKVPQQKKRK